MPQLGAKEKQLGGSDKLIASLLLHHLCPREMLPICQAFLICLTTLPPCSHTTCTAQPAAAQAAWIRAAGWQVSWHDAPPGRVSLTDTSAAAPGHEQTTLSKAKSSILSHTQSWPWGEQGQLGSQRSMTRTWFPKSAVTGQL